MLTKLTPPWATNSYASALVRRDDERVHRAVADALDALLIADVFDAAALEQFSRPVPYSLAAEMLRAKCGGDDRLISAIHDDLPLRIGQALGIYRQADVAGGLFPCVRASRGHGRAAGEFRRALTLHEIVRGQSKKRAALAHVALACRGAPLKPWAEMSECERAALMLGALVRGRTQQMV